MAEKRDTASNILARLGNMKDEPPGTFSLMFTRNRMKEDAERAREDEDAKVRRHAEIRAEVEIRNRPQAAKIRWNGTAVDFADWVAAAWERKQIETETVTAAFELACQHFSQKDGRSFKPRSLQVSRKFRNETKK